jgi:23S rRNA (pseudouridine1915-N3)-methyltransferase
LGDAIAEYDTRAARYWPLIVHPVREEAARGLAPEQVIRKEGERLLAAVSTSSVVVACDARGRTMASEQFAAWLGKQRDEARDVAFVIGGAFGLSPDVLGRATFTLALAPWTLPHELARLVLGEQLYRAGTILRGEPYHK